MGEFRLERHPAVVEQDLPEIYAFIARDDHAAAERVLDAVEAGFSQLTRHPESGVAFPTRNPRLKNMRMLPLDGYPNYLIFYAVESESIRILYVTHGSAPPTPLLPTRAARVTLEPASYLHCECR